jgi:hypothetical protein
MKQRHRANVGQGGARVDIFLTQNIPVVSMLSPGSGRGRKFEE